MEVSWSASFVEHILLEETHNSLVLQDPNRTQDIFLANAEL